MFLNTWSDVWNDKYDEYRKQMGNKDDLIKRKWAVNDSYCRENCTFDYYKRKKNDSNLGGFHQQDNGEP